ncbi:putative ribosomal protein L20 [Helianthus debilis subsp. tardiflorus]
MTRIRRGYIARRRRTKIRLFASSFRGAHSRLTRTITQQKIRALVSAHRDRDRQKINFHKCFFVGTPTNLINYSSRFLSRHRYMLT